MRVSEGLQGSGVEIDSSVGTIVWVRRRNGSWWPGRILSPNELSDSHLMSPRSGTPVKLLGREDASVDWYNLEKSKRVKAFRCGEFDDCIERAESSQGGPIKKREKYARREDAILHALELEKQQLAKEQQKLGSASNNVFGELNPRIRGLRDIGIKNIKSKRNLCASLPSESTRKSSSVGNHVHVLPIASRNIRGLENASSSKRSLSLKRKRIQEGLTGESVAKKRDRRRPLVQVLKSSEKLPVSNNLQFKGDDVTISAEREKVRAGVICRAKRSQCVYLPAVSSDSLDNTEVPLDQKKIFPSQFGSSHFHADSSTEDTSLMDETECNSSEPDYLNPDTDEDRAVSSDYTPDTGPINSGRYVNNYKDQGQTGSMSSDELDGSAVTASAHISHLHNRNQIGVSTSDADVSEWQLKRKRNIRSLTVGDGPRGLIRKTHMEGKGRYKSKERGSPLGFYHENLNHRYNNGEDDLIDRGRRRMNNQGSGFIKRKYPFMLKSHPDEIESEEDFGWNKSEEGLNPLYVGYGSGSRRDHMLVDVDLKVQTSHQGEHVPLVSLMSRLNGKAIIGHPVQIETLEDGAADLSLSRNNNFEERPQNDENPALTPVWTTARRTVTHRNRRYVPKSLEKKSSKKLQKKVSFPSQKTRTLSSIATQQKLSKPDSGRTVNGLIKPDDTGSTTITCIPVKLVFSRLTEAIGRPSSRTSNSTVAANNTERRIA